MDKIPIEDLQWILQDYHNYDMTAMWLVDRLESLIRDYEMLDEDEE